MNRQVPKLVVELGIDRGNKSRDTIDIDSLAKGIEELIIATIRRIEENNKAKLTAEKVREIRALCSANRGINHGEVGLMYGVQGQTISAIMRGRLWKHV